jgi:aspartate dehydrogenase
MQIGLIGFGAIGQEIAARLSQPENTAIRIRAVLLRADSPSAAVAVAAGFTVVTRASELSALGVTWVIECAGHSALARHGGEVLAQGLHLLVASVGALANDELRNQLFASCQKGAQILFCSGALGGLDALASARHTRPLSVTYISEKPVSAWRDTPAQHLIALDDVQGCVTFFTGSAREAALQFPQNANVAAAVAFAGVGLDNTQVELRAVKGQTVNRHQIIANGAFGSLHSTVEGQPLARNPKTSMLAAMSLLEATVNQSRALKLV